MVYHRVEDHIMIAEPKNVLKYKCALANITINLKMGISDVYSSEFLDMQNLCIIECTI